MLLLDGSRQHLRAALDHARMGSIKDARFQLVEARPQLLCLLHRCVLSKHIFCSFGLTSVCAAADGQDEELLLHVFGTKLPSGYELGLFKDLCSRSSTSRLAVAQSKTLFKV